MKLSSELIVLILPHLSRDALISVSIINQRLHKLVEHHFYCWANTLLSNDNHFAQLEIAEVIQYLKRAQVTFVVDRGVTHNRSPSFVQTCEELHRFRDVPKIIGANYEDYKPDNIYVLGLNNFFSVSTGEIVDVADVQERDKDSYYLLMKDGTILVAGGGRSTKLDGCYRKISSKYALTYTGELIDISENKSKYDFDLSKLPKIIDFDYSDTGGCMPCTLSYITLDKEAWSWQDNGTLPMKLLERAKRLVCSDQVTYVLNEDNEVHSFYISDQEEERGPIVKCVLDIQRRYHGGYEDEIALVTRDRVNICNTIMISDHSGNRYEARLRQKLYLVKEGISLIIDETYI